MNGLIPLFRDGIGRTSADPLELAGATPTVDLTALGLLLAPPALLGEFIPRTLWRGVERVESALPRPQPGSLLHVFAPLADRYHPRLPSAYLRCKAQIVRLLPRPALPVLPRRKQYFSSVLAQQATGVKAPLAVEVGLLDPDALAAETSVARLLTIAAIERWLTGAEKAGAVIG